MNFDSANGWAAGNAASFTVSYGVDQTSLLTISRTDGGGNFGPTAGSSQSKQTSGDQILGIGGGSSPVTFTFSEGLDDWGITELDRQASRDVTMTFTLQGNTTIAYALQNQDPSGNNSGALNWYGVQASNDNPITKVSIVSNGFVRYDDMAFVVATPALEPTTIASMLGGLGMLALRRRRGATVRS